MKKKITAEEKIKELKLQLWELYDAPIQEVTDKCSPLSRTTVSKCFNGHKVKPTSTRKIIQVCKVLIEEAEKENERLLK